MSEVRSPARENMFSFFNFDIVNLLLNFNRGGNKRPNLVIFGVWYTLIVGGLVLVRVLVTRSRKSCLGPLKSHLCVPGFIQECETQGESKISSFCF